jgi:flavodoxin
MSRNLPSADRRSVLRSAAVGLAGALVGAGASGCTTGDPMPAQGTPPTIEGTVEGRVEGRKTGAKVLLAYFSRAGENYHYGGRRDLDVGNTEVLAGMISGLIGCDVHRIEAAVPYPDDYDATVARNVREQNEDSRPAIAKPLPSIDRYDTVVLASGIWNIRAPMIMATFTESHVFAGKTVHPVTTYAMSGLGTTERDYSGSCAGATLGEGLAVRGEEVGKSSPEVEDWLRRTGLLA